MQRRPFFSLIAAAALVAFSGSNRAGAAVILTFGQSGSGDTVSATVNGADTQTTITASAVPVTITQIIAGAVTPVGTTLNLSATSVGAATSFVVGGVTEYSQAFSGNFSFTTGGTNYLSGTFTDAVFGTGTGLTLTASNGTGGESLSFNSNVIPAADLGDPLSLQLSFSNVTPPVGITGTTLSAFVSSIGGNASANPVPEPSSMAIAGLGALGLIGYGLRRRKALGA